uniref:Uncharacterized protein n=1 Tax=Picea glauca TaxID=3330 RepID=A0A101M1M6_PICGL|nr:hypothetical protein ABT39_MTgene3807 [Picea glauca]
MTNNWLILFNHNLHMEPMDLLPPIGQLANSLSKPQQPALPGKKTPSLCLYLCLLCFFC